MVCPATAHIASHRIILGGDDVTYLAPDWVPCLECGSNEVFAGSLWIDERPHRAAVRGPEGWQPVGRRDVTYIAREVVVLPLATGAILAITNDTVDWWDGADGYTAIASGVPRTEAWARALLATDDYVVVGGVGAWTSGGPDDPLSSGIAIWDFD